MADTVEIHALAGAYALDAVDDIERAAFERHLRDCQPCSTEVAELRETAAWLTYPAAETPPPGLRDAVLTAIASTPQQRVRRTATPSGRTAQDRWRRWTAMAVAASILGIGVGAGTWAVQEQRVQQVQADNARVDAVLAASDARLITQNMGGGRVTLVVSPSRDAAVAVLNGLDAPGNGKSYQLWMIEKPGGPYHPVGVVASGTARQYIKGVQPVFGITREPLGGSPQPTLSALVGPTIAL